MSLSSNLDLDAIKDILTDRGIDWSVPWTPDMFIDGWEECRGTISDALNAFPKLVEECERLRQELATAKAEGAADILEGAHLWSRPCIWTDSGMSDRAVSLDLLQKTAAELRKGIK